MEKVKLKQNETVFAGIHRIWLLVNPLKHKAISKHIYFRLMCFIYSIQAPYMKRPIHPG